MLISLHASHYSEPGTGFGEELLQPGRLPGRGAGAARNLGRRGAAKLGLSGQVGKKEFDRLCDNLHPITGRQLTPRMRADRTVGYDFNFHCPKGVSLAYLMLRDERILEAFETSVDETMDEAEADARVRVRRGGRYEDRVTGNLCHGWSKIDSREPR